MEPFVRNFIRASLLWFAVGVLLGVAMVFWPAQALGYRTAHLHANLLGFVSMMIFGVAYHVIPRFTGNALPHRALALAHLWVANVGLALLVGGWMLRVHAFAAGTLLLRTGAAVGALGAGMFIYNLWRTLAPRPRVTPLRPAAPQKH